MRIFKEKRARRKIVLCNSFASAARKPIILMVIDESGCGLIGEEIM